MTYLLRMFMPLTFYDVLEVWFLAIFTLQFNAMQSLAENFTDTLHFNIRVLLYLQDPENNNTQKENRSLLRNFTHYIVKEKRLVDNTVLYTHLFQYPCNVFTRELSFQLCEF